jgi:hypothetical protein
VAVKTLRSANELLDLEVLPHATKEALKSHVRRGVHVLHLLGHGDVETQKAQLGLFHLSHSESPTSDILTATELQGWIREAEIKPRLVVLAACHTGNPGPFGILGVATALLDVGVEAVVSMQTVLYTDQARDFTQAFYQALVDSYWVDDAVRAGRKALEAYQGPADAGTLIFSRSAGKKQSTRAVGRLHPVDFGTVVEDREARNVLYVPPWSVPALFLQAEGWLGLELPASPYTWSADGREMIYVGDGRLRFYMDKYPVTRGEYRKFAERTRRPIPKWKDVDWQALANSLGKYFDITDAIRDAWERHLPATRITIQDAQAYAAWAGKHLPTPEEWQQAALSGCSDQNVRYPWGNNLRDRVCNTHEARSHQLWSVVLSGEHFETCSAAGVCDIVGNASEWAQDEDGRTYVCGGSFKDYGEKCAVQALRLIKDRNLLGDSIGFRCAATLTEWMNVQEGPSRPKKED